MKLRFTDFIYLLNILKLQRAKLVEGEEEMSKEEVLEQWISDLHLALSIVLSADDCEL